jgi:hypothetical protein
LCEEYKISIDYQAFFEDKFHYEELCLCGQAKSMFTCLKHHFGREFDVKAASDKTCDLFVAGCHKSTDFGDVAEKDENAEIGDFIAVQE